MADDFYGYEDEGAEPKGHDNLFLWTVFILLLIGLAFGCWLGSFYVFGHPEHPKAYALLKKLKKIDPPRRFEVTAGPQGEFLGAQKLFERYSKFSRLELERENAELIRNYLRNYRETKKLVTYATGRYVLMEAFDLKKTDMFPSGVVALAQSADFPQVILEHIYTAPPRSIPAMRAVLTTGFDMKLERTTDLAAVIHVEKIPDGRMQFTVVPLLYSDYAVKQGSGRFSLEPPPTLNMEPGLPVVRAQGLQEGLRKYATYRKGHPLAPTTEPGAAPPAPSPELVRVDTVAPGTKVPETGAMPEVPVATPLPIPGRATPIPRPIAAVATPAVPRPAVTPSINVTMLNTPAPRAVPVATPSGAAPPRPLTSPDGVPLQPFVAAQRNPNMPTSGATWRTYSPGQAPAARAVSLEEAGPLADRGDVGERLYLRGEFRVTASGSNRAVLRDANKSDDQSPRVVVEYPAGAVPPPERERFARDAARPYLITDVRRGADGVVTIYVREIINP